MSAILIKDIMLTEVITATPDQTTQTGAAIMAEKDVGLLVICENCSEKTPKPIGIVTREDIINKITQYKKDPSSTKLRDIMNITIMSCSPEDSIEKAATDMLKYGFKRLPVISQGKLVGLVTYKEIVKAMPTSLEVLREKFLKSDPLGAPLKFVPRKPTHGNCETCENYSDTLKQLNGKWICGTCLDTSSELE